MKILLYIILIVIFISCNEYEDVCIEQNPTTYFKLNLENDSIIQLWCKCSFSFDALNVSDDWNIESDDETIVTVSNENSHFILHTHKPGLTKLFIKDKKFCKTISLNSIGFADYWKESQLLDMYYPNYLGIAVDDTDIYNAIRMDLHPLYLNRGIEYNFRNNGNLTVLIPAMGDPIEGSYDFNDETQTLTLDYNNIHESFYCDIQPYTEKTTIPRTTDRFIVALHQNLTEEYRHKYPETKIDSVYIIRHIVSLGSWWIASKTS